MKGPENNHNRQEVQVCYQHLRPVVIKEHVL